MSVPDFVQDLVSPYGPTLPNDEIVIELNKLYHSFEAKDYDQLHPEVHEQLPPIWSQMIETVLTSVGDRTLNILDFGCGTGFEATQILAGFAAGRIQSLTCYDPSPEMLAICRGKVFDAKAKIRFCDDFSQILQTDQPYNLLATNSLLHHLPSPGHEVGRLESVLAKDAWWLMGHEPSRRFFRNAECCHGVDRYRRQLRMQKLGSFKACVRTAQRLLCLGDYPAAAAARAAHKAGLFQRRPSASTVSRLVDLHVPQSDREASAGRGFDFEKMDSELERHWQLKWVKTYAFMGPFTEGALPDTWRTRYRQLSSKYPLDGANFCSVWSHR